VNVQDILEQIIAMGENRRAKQQTQQGGSAP